MRTILWTRCNLTPELKHGGCAAAQRPRDAVVPLFSLGVAAVYRSLRRHVNAYVYSFALDQKRLHIVSRDFVRTCQTPMLIMSDDVPAHPYAVCMEVAELAPKAEVPVYPWKEPKDLIPQAVRHVRDFLRAHQPVTSAR